MADTKHDSEKLVRDFLGSWEDRDLDVICSAFADDAVYHNVPVAPIEGIAGIRAIFKAFLEAFAEASSTSSRWPPSRAWCSPSASTTSR
jgi:limonene-1,2-epoxide hydrolase